MSKPDPSTQASAAPYPRINALECKGCGRCVDACPKHVLKLTRALNARGYRYVDGSFWQSEGSPYTMAGIWDE